MTKLGLGHQGKYVCCTLRHRTEYNNPQIFKSSRHTKGTHKNKIFSHIRQAGDARQQRISKGRIINLYTHTTYAYEHLQQNNQLPRYTLQGFIITWLGHLEVYHKHLAKVATGDVTMQITSRMDATKRRLHELIVRLMELKNAANCHYFCILL